MTTLQARIVASLTQAMREKNELARETYRMLKAEIMQREVTAGRPLTEPECLDVLGRAVKTRKETIEQCVQGGRAELAAKEQAEIGLIEAFLPKALSRDEAERALRALAAELGAAGAKDMGRLMKAVRERFPGQLDGKLAAELAKEILG